MNTVHITIWGMVAAVSIFTVVGLLLFVQALRPDPDAVATHEHDERGFRAAMKRYVGPVERSHALLNAPVRVSLELICASCGIPGLGWMASTRVAVGLPLLAIAPSFIYGFYPVYLAVTGHILDSPLEPLRYLPVLGVTSAGLLALAEWHEARQP